MSHHLLLADKAEKLQFCSLMHVNNLYPQPENMMSTAVYEMLI